MEEPSEKSQVEQPEANRNDQIKLPTVIIPTEASIKEEIEREEKINPKTRENAKKVGDNRKRFWNMLVSTIERSGYKPPQGRQTKILDLACGVCEEGIVLSAFFGGGSFGNSNENVKIIGVDIKKKEIEDAISSYSKSGVLQPNYEFITGDATNLDQYQQIPSEVDAVVIRHQQISVNEDVWTKIFQQALQGVNKEGIVIITSFSDIEHEILIEALQKLDCEIVINESNPYAKPLSDEEISLDRNIAIIKRLR